MRNRQSSFFMPQPVFIICLPALTHTTWHHAFWKAYLRLHESRMASATSQTALPQDQKSKVVDCYFTLVRQHGIADERSHTGHFNGWATPAYQQDVDSVMRMLADTCAYREIFYTSESEYRLTFWVVRCRVVRCRVVRCRLGRDLAVC